MRRLRILLFFGILVLSVTDAVLLVRDDWKTSRVTMVLLIILLVAYKETSTKRDGKH